MVGQARRAAIKKRYRLLRLAAEKTQLEVEALARLDAGRYWKIENAVIFPTSEERTRLARVLKVSEADLPSLEIETAVAP